MEMRLYLKLNMTEYQALAAMAQAELREDREQLRYLLREEAQRRGLLIEASAPTAQGVHTASTQSRAMAGGAPCLS